MKIVLATVLVVLGIFIWMMMHSTSLGYNPWGISITIAALLTGVWIGTDKS